MDSLDIVWMTAASDWFDESKCLRVGLSKYAWIGMLWLLKVCRICCCEKVSGGINMCWMEIWWL